MLPRSADSQEITTTHPKLQCLPSTHAVEELYIDLEIYKDYFCCVRDDRSSEHTLNRANLAYICLAAQKNLGDIKRLLHWVLNEAVMAPEETPLDLSIPTQDQSSQHGRAYLGNALAKLAQ